MTTIINKAPSAAQTFSPTASAWLSSYPVLAALIETLEGDARTAKVLSEGAYNEASGLREQRGNVKARAARTHAAAAEVHRQPDPARVQADQAEVDKLDRALVRADAELEHRSKVAADAAKLLAEAKDVIAQFASTGAAPRLVTTKLPPGRPLDIITEQRQLIAEASKGTPVINTAPPPREDTEQALIAELTKLMDNAPFRISRLGSSKPSLNWPIVGIEAEPTARGDLPHTVDARALFAWAFQEDLIEEIKRQVAEQYAGVVLTLNLGQKLIALGEIADTIHAAERIEAAATFAARAEGLDVPFRGDIDPYCVLGLSGRKKPPRKDNRFGIDE